MNPDQTSRDEIEVKITALLLGELPADEAKLLRYTIAQDAGLQKLHDELAQTIVLVREVEKAPASAPVENAAPLKLSEERRAKLLAQFKKSSPPPKDPLFWLKRIDVSRIQAPRLLTVLAVLAIVAVLAAMMLPALSKAKNKSSKMTILAAAKQREMAEQMRAQDEAQVAVTLSPTAAPASSTDLNFSPARLDSFGATKAEVVTVAPATPIILPPTEVPQLVASTAEPLISSRGTSLFAQSDFSDEKKKLAAKSLPEQKVNGINFKISSDAEALAKADTLVRDGKVLFENGRLEESIDKLNQAKTLAPDSAAAEYYLKLNDQAQRTRQMGLASASSQDRLVSAEKRLIIPITRNRSEISGVNSFGRAGGGGGGGAGGAFVANNDLAYFDDGAKRSAGENASANLNAPSNLGEEYRRNAPTGAAGPVAAYDFQLGVSQENLTAASAVSGAVGGNVEVAKSKTEDSGQLLTDGLRNNGNLALGDKFYRQPTREIALVNGSIAPAAVAASAKSADQNENLYFAAGDFSKRVKESESVDKSGRGTLALDDSHSFMGTAVASGGTSPLSGAKDSFKAGTTQSDANGTRYAIDSAPGLPMGSPTGGNLDFEARLKLAMTERDSRFSKNEHYIDLAKTKNLPADVVAKLDQPSRQIVVQKPIFAERKPAALEDQPLPKPALNAAIPQPEILTRENNFSTFSLNVSDVSFKLAAASLEKGQLPDAASIRSEEFINAFDYRDPEAAAGQPLAFASERAAYPFAQSRDLLRFSVKTAAAGRVAGRPLNLVLLLDNSGSMERADRVAIIREALRVLGTQLQPQDTVSVVTFARTARLWADGVTGDKAGETLKNIGGLTPEGGTNLEEAMRLAYETARRHYVATGLNRVVLLTDGAANLGDVNPADLKQKVEAQRKQGIALDCFGIGSEDFNDDLLEQLSRNGDGRYAFLNSTDDASKEFAAKLAGALQIAASDVKVQVEFNPQRVISYRQIGYAKHQITKQQFRDNTVDAAEIAAQEAGNALYTVETKADGVGPIATVRVRYKVPGTTDYRERSWEVPYDGSAVSLNQSSAAMRLAATASAFSEWLVASPFAQEVTPDELLKMLSGVPQIYGADQRPQKLEWMIRQAKSVARK